MSYYNYKVLGQVNPATSTTTALYTVPASTNAIVSTITICNQAATGSTYSIAVRPGGATLDPKHYINYNATIPALDTISLTMGLTLAPTDVISVIANNSSTSFNVFGTQVTETLVIDLTTATSVEYLIVGGGGGGGYLLGGGGGGGGVVTSGAYTVTPGSPITVTVGAAGAAATTQVNGGTGGNSSIAGTNDYSVLLNGTSQYLTVAGNAAFAFGTGDYTVEMWMYPTSASWTSGNFYLWDICGGNVTLQYYQNQLSFYNSTIGAGSALYNSGKSLPLNTWAHVAIARQSGTTRMFVNGTFITSVADSFNVTQAGTVYFGAASSANGWFPGYYSNLRVVKGTAVYTTAFTPSRSPLTAITNTSLLTLQNSTFLDNSGNNFTVTTISSPTLVNTNIPFNTGLGGGGGGPWQGVAGTAGGSGGGGAGSDSTGGAGGVGTQSTSTSGGYGNNGGAGNGGRLGGGGGGAGGTGYAGGATALSAGTGGVGFQSSISSTSTYYAGGGGGGFESANAGNTYGRGGLGGGGDGGYSSGSYNGSAGTTNTGGGGGGGGNQSGAVSGLGAAGGSGIVIIRYLSNYYPATANTNATYISTSGYNIYTFRTSGTLTI